MSIKPVLSSLLVGVVLPLVAAGAVLAVTWDDLPAQVAVHWGPGGQPDGFVDLGPALVAIAVGLPLVVYVVMAAIMLTAPPSAPGIRWLRALPAGVCWFTTAVVILSVAAQVGAQGADTPLRWWWMAAAIGLGVIGTALTAAVVPGAAPLPHRDATPPPDAPRLPTSPGQVWWAGTAPSGRAVPVIAVLVLVPGIVLSVVGAWWSLLLIAPAALLVAMSAVFRVTVGAERLVVAGGFAGWPRLRIPLDTVAAARVTTTGVWEWGGWGLRSRPRGTGVITRAGEALALTRTDGSQVVITVDDAGTAAAVVNTLLDRHTGADDHPDADSDHDGRR